MDHRADPDALAGDVRRLLNERYRGDHDSCGIALAAAQETAGDERVLDELARAWHVTRIEQARAAAGLSGAIAVLAQRLPEAEIVRRTGVPLETVRALTAPPDERWTQHG
ncbi:hypothetical protein [Arenivirga flava]|uniref:Uncharacterized protein n=1 Tax=Arenivirga flava TaxID=1930060 RepID=A0AA37UHK9_9MICO|nr:hypothetical protein [Arenivirga flava]GMA29003.1 hypothetical protein GCM10025874_22560 [Arenivirga flava]